jgi:hypothetical protein
MVKDIQSLKTQITSNLDSLSADSLQLLNEFVTFLRLRTHQPEALQDNVVKLGGLWEGYTFSEEEITAARGEAWKNLGQDFDE